MKTRLPLYLCRRCAQKLGRLVLPESGERGLCHQCGEHRPLIHRDDLRLVEVSDEG